MPRCRICAKALGNPAPPTGTPKPIAARVAPPATAGADASGGPTGEEAPAPQKPVSIVVSLQSGLRLESSDKNFTARVGGQLTAESRTFISNTRQNDSIFLSRARPLLTGTLYRDYEYKVLGDFGRGSAKLQDGFVAWKKLPWLRVRVGQFPEPMGNDEFNDDFIEPNVADILSPGRDIGIDFSGTLCDESVEYQVGYFNGNGKNSVNDANDDKDLAARCVWYPYQASDDGVIKGVQVGAAVTYGHQKQSFGSFSALASETTFLKMNDGVFNRGNRTRFNFEGGVTWGPYQLFGQARWLNAELERTLGAVTKQDSVLFSSYYASLLWVLTGENAWDESRRPRRNFGSDGGPGQIELAARYGQFWAGDELFDQGFASSASSSQGLDSWTAGVSWWLNPKMLVQFNLFHTDFWDDFPVGGQVQDSETGILGRYQISF